MTVGIVANPDSGRDIRQLGASVGVMPPAEKADMIERMLGALGEIGVPNALVSVDLGGISAGVFRALRSRRPSAPPWPEVSFVDEGDLTETADDTRDAVRQMVAAGARVIVCLGGDGAARVAADALTERPDVPLLPLAGDSHSTFPQRHEATVAGLAAGLFANGSVRPELVTERAPALRVTAGARTELALVDVCVADAQMVGSGTSWSPSILTALYCAFAEPDAVGPSAVAGLLCPSPRGKPDGVALRLGRPETSRHVIRAPLAPGRVMPVGVRDWRTLPAGEPVQLTTPGMLALDCDSEMDLHRGEPATVTLSEDGPLILDVATTLREAAQTGALHGETAPVSRFRRRSSRLWMPKAAPVSRVRRTS